MAGSVVPVLQDAGVLGSQVSITCPAQGRQPPPPVTVADLQDLWNQTSRQEFRQQALVLAGHYAYSLGYREGDSLRGLSRRCDGLTPIMADYRRGESWAANSPNHGGLGRRAVYRRQRPLVHAAVCRTRGRPHLPQPQRPRCPPALCAEDTVLGSSDATPGP